MPEVHNVRTYINVWAISRMTKPVVRCHTENHAVVEIKGSVMYTPYLLIVPNLPCKDLTGATLHEFIVQSSPYTC